jgi:hypothetical protein
MAQVPNDQIVQLRKEIITLADTLSAAGKSNPELNKEFIDYVFDLTGLGALGIRVESFMPDKAELHKIIMPDLVMLTKEEAADPNYRVGFSHEKVELNPKSFIVPIEISKDYFQYNLEGDTMEEKAVRLFATVMKNNVEKIAFEADVVGPAVKESERKKNGSTTQYIKDSVFSQFDGFVRQADSAATVVDADGAPFSSTQINQGILGLPVEHRDRRELKGLLPSDLEQNLRHRLSARGTGFGDLMLEGDRPVKIFSVDHPGLALFPFTPRIVEDVTLTGTTPVNLRYKDVSGVVVLPSTLGLAPTTPYVLTTDYILDTAAGTIVRPASGSAISSGQVVKVTYNSPPQALYTKAKNLIMAIGLDMEIEYDSDIYKRTWQAAIHFKYAVKIEETKAVCKVINLSRSA